MNTAETKVTRERNQHGGQILSELTSVANCPTRSILGPQNVTVILVSSPARTRCRGNT
jgi:hypothetical protein